MTGIVAERRDVDWISDLDAWVNYAGKRWGLSPADIVLIGHSTGAGVINAYLGRYPKRRHAAVLITPPRYDKLGEAALEQEEPFVWRRWAAGIRHPELPVDLAREIGRDLRLENLSRNVHGRRVLLVDTPRTMETTRLLGVVEAVGRKASVYLAPPEVTHYFGTGGQLNRHLSARWFARAFHIMFLSDGSLDELVRRIEAFMDAMEPRRSSVGTSSSVPNVSAGRP